MPVLEALITCVQFVLCNPVLAVLTLLVIGVIYIVSHVLPQTGCGRNPFSDENIKRRKPLITDEGARDNIIKQRFKASKVQEKYDVIVIGSGAGGLGTAVFLARSNKKVLVLEQHDQAGGTCHTFVEKGFEFDTGIHYVGSMNHGHEDRVLVDQVTDGQIEFARMDKEFDIVAIGESSDPILHPMVSGTQEEFRDNLIKQFPNERDAIDNYLNLMNKELRNGVGCAILKILPKSLARKLISTKILHLITRLFVNPKTVQQVINSLTDNKELRVTLGYLFGDYGVAPAQASFFYHCMVMNHYMQGAFYPIGGTTEMTLHMIPIIERAGGKVLVCAPVSRILTDDKGKVCGVAVAKTSGDIEIFADTVISSAGVLNTLNLLPEPVAKKTHLYSMAQKQNITSGTSYISTFIGLDGTDEEMGLKANNIWYFRGDDIDELNEKYEALLPSELATAEVPMLFISSPSKKDPSWKQRRPGKSVVLVIGLCRYDWFKDWEQLNVKHRGDEYEAIKMSIGKTMLKHAINFYPKIADKIEYFDVGTPLSNRHYLGGPKGEMYGLDQDITRFSMETLYHLRPDIGVPGLLLTGQDILTGGYIGALKGAMITASKYLKRNIFIDFYSYRFKTWLHPRQSKEQCS